MSFTAVEIQQTVKSYLISNFFLNASTALEPDTSFLESGIIDSTGILEVIQFIEETFKIKVEDMEMVPENLDSIGNVARYVLKKTA